MLGKPTSHARTANRHRLSNGTSLNFESLEARCMLTGLSLVSFEHDTNVVAFASANEAAARNSAETTASAQAGDGGASALQTSIAHSRVSTESPSLGVGGYTYGRMSVIDGRADAGDHNYNESDSDAAAEFLAEYDGLLHVVIIVQLDGRSAASASPFGASYLASSAYGDIFGAVSVEFEMVGWVHAQGEVTSTSTTDTSTFEIDGMAPDSELSQISGSESISAILSFSVAVSEGDHITLHGNHQLNSGATGIDPISGWADAYAAIGGSVSINATLESFPTPPPSPPPLKWYGVVAPGESGEDFLGRGGEERYGDFDGDGDMDDADLAEYFALFRTETPLIVTTGDDELDDPVTNPAGYAFGDLSLREALALAADIDHPGEDVIGFAPWVRDITLDGSQLDVDSDVNIVGLGADRLTMDANGASRIFLVDSGVDATISGMTLTGGNQNGGGGAIYNRGDLTLNSVVVTGNQTNTGGGGVFVDNGTLVVESSTFDGNHATGAGSVVAWGGGVAGAFASGTSLTITDSTFSNNTSDGHGGGLAFKAYSGSMTGNVTNSTFSGNAADFGGAIITELSTSTLNLLNSTITNNTASTWIGGGVFKGDGAATITANNTIVAQNHATVSTYASQRDVAGAMSSSTRNVIGIAGTSGLTNTAGNKVGISTELDAKLAPLGDYGGKTKTHATLLLSPALDAGKDSLAGDLDQRGFNRKHDLPTTDGAGGYSDIGAYEAGEGTTLTVRSDGDRNDSIALTATVADLRLREALALSSALAGREAITFDESLFGSGAATINLTYDGPDGGSVADSLDSSGGVDIIGPGAHLLTVNGSGQNSVFRIAAPNSTTTTSIEGITITNGGGSNGGGVHSTLGQLSIRDARIVGNSVTGTGGGVMATGSLSIIGSEVSDNTATLGGGGVSVLHAASGYDSSIINTTISGNEATSVGSYAGGIYLSVSEDGENVIVNSTITNNSAANGGGMYVEDTPNGFDVVLVHNSIIVDNFNLSYSAANDIAGQPLISTSSGNLMRSGHSGGASGLTNILLTGSDTARLAPLGFYGGPTRTHVPYSDSDAIDAGDDAIAALYGVEFDQRGSERPVDWDSFPGDDTDIGAVELAFGEEHT